MGLEMLRFAGGKKGALLPHVSGCLVDSQNVGLNVSGKRL